MITLRAFPDSTIASIAKAVLDDHGIFCALADEDAHTYTPGAAVHVRLLVKEEQAEEAVRLLDSFENALPDDFDGTES